MNVSCCGAGTLARRPLLALSLSLCLAFVAGHAYPDHHNLDDRISPSASPEQLEVRHQDEQSSTAEAGPSEAVSKDLLTEPPADEPRVDLPVRPGELPEEELEAAPGCGSIKGTVRVFRDFRSHKVVYAISDCTYCPPEPERSEFRISESMDGFDPTFLVMPSGAELVLENAYEQDISTVLQINPNPEDSDDRRPYQSGNLQPGDSEVVVMRHDNESLDASHEYHLSPIARTLIRGRVLVTPNQCFAVAGEDGSYEIGELPPGTYTLKAYSYPRRARFATATVEVRANQVTIQNFMLDDRTPRRDRQ